MRVRPGLGFVGSPRHTLGVELEVGIVDDVSGELACSAPEILAELGGDPDDAGKADAGKVKAELFESTLEMVTGVCRTPGEARSDLAATIADLGPLLAARGLSLISCGVHPFSGWERARVTRDDRYERIVERFQWPVRRLTIYGVHVHVGVPTGDHAVAATNALTGLLAPMLALSASSPFWYGRDTGLASVRTRLWEVVPSSGVPPRLGSWDDFEQLVAALRATGTIDTTRDLWWDIRPSPLLGTVEMRICDSMSSLDQVCALAALAQAAVAHVCARLDGGEAPLAREPEWVIRENKWRACRFGLDAELVHADGSVVGLRDEVRQWVDLVRPQAGELGGAAWLDRVLGLLDATPSYARQRAVVEDGGGIREVVGLLCGEFAANVAPGNRDAVHRASLQHPVELPGPRGQEDWVPGGREATVPR